MKNKIIKLFLRLSLAAGFLSAVADRFGMWHYHVAWGSWDRFLVYTGTLNSWLPASVVPLLAVIATIGEIIFAFALIVGFKTRLFANLSGLLLLAFALSMTISTGLKTALDASVYVAAAGSFSLSMIKERFLEIDILLKKGK